MLKSVIIIELLACILGDTLDCTPKAAAWNNVVNPNAPFFTQEICDGLYAYGNGISMGMFLVSDTGVIMVDAPASMKSTISSVVSSITSNPITTVIYSHHHGDHIGAAAQIANIDTAEIVCHEQTAANIDDRPSLAPQCTKTLHFNHGTKSHKIKDGNKEVIVSFAGYRWHTNNDLFIFAAKQRTIMVVDLVFPDWIPYKYFGMSSSPDKYREAHDYVLSITSAQYGDWINYIGGHVDAIGTRDSVHQNAQYYDDLLYAATQAQRNVQFGPFLQQNFPDGIEDKKWQFLSAFSAAVSEECNRIMKETYEWDSKLKDYDAFGKDNCHWYISNLRIQIS